MLTSLNALRFLFALMVFVSHLNYITPKENAFWDGAYQLIFRAGYIGVSFFFMLSGYILAYRYADEIKNKSFSFRTFIGRRAARILPMYYVGLLVALPYSIPEFMLGDKVFYFKKLLSNIVLLQAFIPINDYYFSFNGVSWSVSSELFFYALFPLIVVYFLKKKSQKPFLIVLTAIIILIGITTALSIDFEDAYYWFYINPFFRIADFGIGVAAFLWIPKYRLTWIQQNGTKAEYIAIGLFAVFTAIQSFVPYNFKLSAYFWIPMMVLIVVFAHSKGKIAQFLANNKLQHLGHLSFAFYLLHDTYFKYYKKYLMPDDFPEYTGWYFLAIFVFSIWTSHLAYTYIEEPCRVYLRNRLENFYSLKGRRSQK